MAACDLDTLVRDVFPRDVWNWMSFVAQEEKDEHWAKLDDGQTYRIVDDAGVDAKTGKWYRIVDDAGVDTKTGKFTG